MRTMEESLSRIREKQISSEDSVGEMLIEKIYRGVVRAKRTKRDN